MKNILIAGVGGLWYCVASAIIARQLWIKDA
jgi:hypothetical protein